MARLVLDLKDEGYFERPQETRRADDSIYYTCPLPDCVHERHQRIWIIQRVPAGQLGHYVAFRINGKEVLYDPTLPHSVDRLPRDAKEVDWTVASKMWHGSSHYVEIPRVGWERITARGDAEGTRPEPTEGESR